MKALGKGKLRTNLIYCKEARPLSRRAPARTPEADGRGPEGAEGSAGSLPYEGRKRGPGVAVHMRAWLTACKKTEPGTPTATLILINYIVST
jgi:hypothetical protein